MKKTIALVLTLLISLTVVAQKKKKNAKVSFEVDGVCMMCKKRIEKAALGVKGVKYALWNVKTHELKLIIDERKTNVKIIKQYVANVGHDTNEVKATSEVYDNLHGCCKYRDEDVKEDHKKKTN